MRRQANANPEERESFEMFTSADALKGGQNLIGFDYDSADVGDGSNRFDVEDLENVCQLILMTIKA